MVYLLSGVALLLGLLALAKLFVSASPATLARVVRGIVVALALLFAVFLLSRGQALLAALVGGLAALFWRTMPMVLSAMVLRGIQAGQARRRSRRFRAAGGGGTGASGASTVETEWLAMRLDHATGRIDGEVRRGPFAGKRLSALGLEELLRLYGDIAREDSRGRPLIESYLDRAHPDWREAQARRAGESAAAGPGKAGMSRAEALDILGLGPEASAEEIKEAHRRLMKSWHPDRGGSDWFAAKLNQAKDTLLGHG